MYHELKCWPEYFEPLASGWKPFELRKDDRGFFVHDTLRIREWDPTLIPYGDSGVGFVPKGYTGREVKREVSYILTGPVLGLAEGWVILGLAHGG